MLRTLINWLDRMAQVDRSRRALSRLSEDQLRDIGITAFEAHQETLRAPWDSQHHGYTSRDPRYARPGSAGLLHWRSR